MKFTAIQENIPESKSRVLTQPIHTKENIRLTEDRPNRVERKKSTLFRKIINNLCGHIRS